MQDFYHFLYNRLFFLVNLDCNYISAKYKNAVGNFIVPLYGHILLGKLMGII